VPDGAVPLLQRLRAEADIWECDEPDDANVASRARHTLSLVGEACRAGRVDLVAVVETDLGHLGDRPYLQPYFAQTQSQVPVTD